MSQEATLAENLVTLKTRSNEKGVSIAIERILKHLETEKQKLKSRKAFDKDTFEEKLPDDIKEIDEIVQEVSIILVKDILKTPANIANAVRLVGECAAFSTNLGKHIIPYLNDFEGAIQPIEVKFAILYLYAKVHNSKNNDLKQSLRAYLIHSLLFTCCGTLENQFQQIEKKNIDAYVTSCAMALEVAGQDLLRFGEETEDMRNMNLYSFATSVLENNAISPPGQRVLCDALASLIVPWRKTCFFEASSKTDEETLMKVLITRIDSRIQNLIKLQAWEKEIVPLEEIKFLTNWCFKSPRLSKLALTTDDLIIRSIFRILGDGGRKNVPLAASTCGLLRNLVRKQVKIHTMICTYKTLSTTYEKKIATGFEINLVKMFRSLFKLYATEQTVINPALACLINFSSSIIGRNTLNEFSRLIVTDILPKFNHLDHEICEYSMGALWGLNIKNKALNDNEIDSWLSAITKVLIYQTDDKNCVFRAIGALTMMFCNQQEEVLQKWKIHHSTPGKLSIADLRQVLKKHQELTTDMEILLSFLR